MERGGVCMLRVCCVYVCVGGDGGERSVMSFEGVNPQDAQESHKVR